MKIDSKLIMTTFLSTLVIILSSVTKLNASQLSQVTMQKLMKVSGYEFQMQGFSDSLISQFANLDPTSIHATDAQIDAIFTEVEKVNSVNLIQNSFSHALLTTISEQQATELLAWYESDIGKSIVLAEQNGSSEASSKQMQLDTQQLLADTSRVSLIDKIIEVANTDRLLLSSQKNIITVVQNVVAKLNRPFAETSDNAGGMLFERNKQITTEVQAQVRLFLLNNLKSFSNEQVEEYYQMLSRPSMRLFLDAFITGFEYGLDTYTTELTTALGDLFVNQGWNIAAHISMAYPAGEDLTFQAFDDLPEKLLVGWTGVAVDFYIEVQEIPTFKTFKKK